MANITGGTDDNTNTLTDLEKALIKGIVKMKKKDKNNTLETIIEFFRKGYPNQADAMEEYVREIWPTL